SAELARSITTSGGAATVQSTSTVASHAEALASVQGASSSDDSADTKADQQVNNNPNSNKGSKTTLPKAGDEASKGSESSASQSGEGSSGVGIAAAVSVNVVTSDNTAKITHGANLSAFKAVKISAQGENDASAKGTGASLDKSASANIGAGIGLNV